MTNWSMEDKARRALRRVTQPAGPSAPATPAPSAVATKAQEHRAAREAATELWTSGERRASVEALRRAIAELGHDSTTWYSYGARMMQLERPDVALEALKTATDLDPANLAALELLIELTADRPHEQGATTRAIEGLAGALEGRTHLHQDALAFVIPARNVAALAVLAHSPDPVVQLATSLNDEARDGASASAPTDLSGIDEHIVTRAQVLTFLGRGSHGKASDLLDGLEPVDIPAMAVRLAVRRELRKGKPHKTAKLLRHYLRAKPGDTWARGKLAKVTANELTNYQLATTGFPFAKSAEQRAYDPDLGRVFYSLHNSLPYHSAGYATRTHGLLSALKTSGWGISGVTRLGYPYDMPGHADDGGIPSVDVVDGVPYMRLSTTPGIERKSPIQGYVGRYGKALADLARQERPAILHGASNHWNGLSVVNAGLMLGIPSVYEVRGLWEVTRGSRDPEWAEGGMYRFMAKMESDAAAKATRVIAITGALRDELVRRGVDEEKILIVPNGVDTERFQPREPNLALAAELGISGKKVIGYVGSILDYEGLGLLIDSAAALKAERDDFVVLIVGDGAERESFQGRVTAEGLEDVVRFTGRVPHEQVEDYYSLIQICPFPRLPLPVCEMVSPLKPFEALAMGKAVVASDVAALNEIIENGVNGLVHAKGDAASLTRQLRRLLDDDELVARLAADGRDWVVANRRWDTLAGRITDLYAELGGVRPGEPG